MDFKREYTVLLFGIGRSIRYHRKRSRFFEIVNSIILFFILILSSASALLLVGPQETNAKFDDWRAIFLGIITLGTAINLSFGIVAKISIHSKFAYLFRDLDRRIQIEKDRECENILREFKNDRLRIESEEPPVLRVLNAICYNEESIASGMKERKKIGFFQILFSYFFDLPPTEIPSLTITATKSLNKT